MTPSGAVFLSVYSRLPSGPVEYIKCMVARKNEVRFSQHIARCSRHACCVGWLGGAGRDGERDQV